MKKNIKIRSAAVAVVIVAALFLGLGGAALAQTDMNAQTVNAAQTADPETVFASRSMQKLAGVWAEAVKDRDGKAQYALMSETLQKAVYDEMSALNWVTGTSSPWIVDYTIRRSSEGVAVIFHYETSAGSAGDYRQELTFAGENGGLKIDSISKSTRVDAAMQKPVLSFTDLTGLMGETKAALLETVGETSYPADRGGLGFDRTGIRVWFDENNAVAKIRIMTGAIDLGGVKLGDTISNFEVAFGTPLSDQNGHACFKYGTLALSVDYDTATGKTAAVYILAENA